MKKWFIGFFAITLIFLFFRFTIDFFQIKEHGMIFLSGYIAGCFSLFVNLAIIGVIK